MKKEKEIIFSDMEKVIKKMPLPVKGFFKKFAIKNMLYPGGIRNILYHPDLYQ
jgi:hypothetical protein